MPNSLRLVAVAVCGLLLPSIGFGQLVPVPDPIGGGDDSKMNALEQNVGTRLLQPPKEVSAAEYNSVVGTAHQYASVLAGDDSAMYTELAVDALVAGISAKQGLGGDRMLGFGGRRRFSNSPEQIWGKPAVQENFQKLMAIAAEKDSGLFPITGPPTVNRIVGPGTQVIADNFFSDCVCVGRRVGATDQFCCTGTLVGKNVIVTAGHCFFCTAGGSPTAVVYVGNDTSAPGKRYTGTAHRHPNYNTGGVHNDLAVIILDVEVPGVTPRRMATTAEIDGATFVRAAGFGNSDSASTGGFGVKRMVDVPVDTTCCCKPGEAAELGCDPNLELVAGFVGLGPDSCNGDSGGPIYVLIGNDARDDAAWAVAGATSRATDLATRPCGDGGIYERLDAFEVFIRNVPGAKF